MAIIKTKSVTDRRKLRFESLDEAVRDAELLVAAEQDGSLRTTGNWTLGQTLGHLAYWADAPFDGYPEMKKMPWLMRMMFSMLKGRFLNKGMPAGARIPDAKEGTFGTEDFPPAEALEKMRQALERIASQAPTVPMPLFGLLTHEEWIKLNLRHAELHLSFWHPAK